MRRNPDAGLRYWLILFAITAVALTLAHGLPGLGRARGEAFAAYAETQLAGLDKERAGLKAAMQEVEWVRLFDPDVLARKGGLAEARAKIATAKAASVDFRTEWEAAQTRIRDRISAESISEKAKAEAMAGFERGLKATGAREAMAIQAEALVEADALVGFLEARRSHWTPQGGKFIFDNQKDLDRLNAHFDKLDGYSARLIALQQRNEQQRKTRGEAPSGR